MATGGTTKTVMVTTIYSPKYDEHLSEVVLAIINGILVGKDLIITICYQD